MENNKIEREAARLHTKYREYMDFYESKSVLGKSRSLVSEDFYSFGKQLDNYSQWQSFVEANGGQSDLGVLPNVALDVIAASATTSVIPMFASIQPMDEIQGTVWYKNVVSRTKRGGVDKGQTLASAINGREKLGSQFAGADIKGELFATGDGTVTKFSSKLSYGPILKRSVNFEVVGTKVKAIDDGEGNLVGVGVSKGTIDYNNGDVVLDLNVAPIQDAKVNVTYATDFEDMEEIPTIGTEYTSKVIKARTFALRSEVGLFKSFAMSKRFGTNPDEIIAQDLVQEINAETSNATVVAAYAASVGKTIWNKTSPTNVGYTEHKLTFLDALADAEGEILKNAGRMSGANILVVGSKAASMISTLAGFVGVRDKNAILGTHYFGNLDNRVIIRSLAMPDNEILLISKGSSFFDSPVIYAPYLPLYVTNMMDGQDHNPLKSQKGVAVQAGVDAPIGTLMTKIEIVEK